MTEQSSRRRHNTRHESQRQRHVFRTFIASESPKPTWTWRDGRWNVRGVWRRYRSALEFISGRDRRKIFAHHSARQAHRTHSPRPWEISRGISRLLWQDKTDWLLKRWHFCQQTVKGACYVTSQQEMSWRWQIRSSAASSSISVNLSECFASRQAAVWKRAIDFVVLRQIWMCCMLPLLLLLFSF